MANSLLIAKSLSGFSRGSSRIINCRTISHPEKISIFSKTDTVLKPNNSGKTNWFSKLFGSSYKKLVKETQNFIKQETDNFYRFTQDIDEIENFETNKAILTEFLNKSPKEFFLTKKEYKGFIDFIKSNGLANEINPSEIVSSKYRQIYTELKDLHTVNYDTAKQIYYKQTGILNPNFQEIKAKIEPKKISLGRNEDRIPHLAEEGDKSRYTLDEVKNMLNESRNLTLENGSFLKQYYSTNDIYDLPFKFASASYNSLAKNGNAYIKTEIPKLFNGIDEKELYESLDLLSTHVRGRIMSSFPQGSVLNLKIGGKDFECVSLGHGLEGNVFRISAKGEKPVILKTYFADSDRSRSLVSFAPSGLYGGLGILREANMAKVVDVPRLYMANPIYKPISGGDSRYMGAWQIVEDASTRKSIGEGLKFKDWLKQKGLTWRDDKSDAWINGVCVDTGFVTASGTKSNLNGGWGDSGINLIYSRYLNGETTEEILSKLKI